MNSLMRSILVACVLCALACGDDSDGDSDAGTDAAAPMDGMDAGPGDAGATPTPPTPPPTPPFTPPPPLECGGEVCMVSAGAAMLGTTACCTDDDKCGGQSALFAGCVELGQPGSYDETCPDFSLADTGLPLTFGGCCTPDGLCGARDGSEGGFGCIPGDTLPVTDTDGGTDEVGTCNYDAAATCTTVLAAECDGPEDCPGSQQCCGAFGGGGYSSFTCQDSCVELTAEGDIWSQICHPGESCDQPIIPDGGMAPTQMPLPDGGVAAYECRMNTMYLPGFWYRCRDTGELPPEDDTRSTAAGEINCGDNVCGDGEKCCYALDPGAAITDGVAHCVAKDEPCTCGTSEGDDAGM